MWSQIYNFHNENNKCKGKVPQTGEIIFGGI